MLTALSIARPLPLGHTVPARLEHFLDRTSLPTPFLVVDRQLVAERLAAMLRVFEGAQLYYAVKANPLPQVLEVLARSGGGCDVASAAEVRLCLKAGIPGARISFGNTIKRPEDIAFAHAVGIARFAVDSAEELEKVARFAPGARVFVRLLVETVGAQWPLSRKFGCDASMALELLRSATALGLEPCGVSFHVGSQQTDPSQWEAPIALCADLDRQLRRDGLELGTINIGGGFPAQYTTPIPDISAYAAAIKSALRKHFGERMPALAIEPGRALVAEAGVIETSVLLVSRKSRGDAHQWVYLDCGKFGGLAETMDEAIRYPLVTPGRDASRVPSIVAGPTCDSADILYERTPYLLPGDLRAGDRVRILSAGAYTYTYASVGFNGLPPLRVLCR
ncbi:MAG: type III PLP-dependent enzyme [Planctomycetes bacterium]|nr:type III PLP-dependent enzyme [Planctomycetota bacterium]